VIRGVPPHRRPSSASTSTDSRRPHSRQDEGRRAPGKGVTTLDLQVAHRFTEYRACQVLTATTTARRDEWAVGRLDRHLVQHGVGQARGIVEIRARVPGGARTAARLRGAGSRNLRSRPDRPRRDLVENVIARSTLTSSAENAPDSSTTSALRATVYRVARGRMTPCSPRGQSSLSTTGLSRDLKVRVSIHTTGSSIHRESALGCSSPREPNAIAR
jgi:hypothetical protein